MADASKRQLTILGIFAHPDDPEFMAQLERNIAASNEEQASIPQESEEQRVARLVAEHAQERQKREAALRNRR